MKKILLVGVVFLIGLILGKEKQNMALCLFGDAEACHNVGYYNHEGLEGTKVNLKKANKYYEKACKKNIYQSCHNLGVLALNNKDYERASRYYKQSCDLGYENSCLGIVAVLEEENKHLEARQYLEKNCNKGNVDSCYVFAGNLIKHEPIDENKAEKIFENLCVDYNYNNGAACAVVGTILLFKEKYEEKHKGVDYLDKSCFENKINYACRQLGAYYFVDEKDKNYEKANKYYEEACKLNDGSACNTVGFHYENAMGYETDLKTAHKYYKKACEEFKDNYGCGSLGYLYLVGNSADDFANESDFYVKACKFNDGENCSDLENFLKNYDFIDRDYKKAKELLEFSCNKKCPESCGVLGVMAEYGKGVEKDTNKAKQMYKKACDLEYKLGCEELERVGNF